MKVLVFSLVILYMASTGLAIKCFICNSQLDPACEDKIQANSSALVDRFVQECEVKANESEPFCRKVKETIYTASVVRYHRECGYKRREGYDCYQKRSEDYVMDVCQCDEDFCNGTPSLISTPFAPLLAALVVPLLVKIM